MQYHPKTLDALSSVLPQSRNTVAIVSAILCGYTNAEILDNPDGYYISNLNGSSLSATLSKIRSRLIIGGKL